MLSNHLFMIWNFQAKMETKNRTQNVLRYTEKNEVQTLLSLS